MTIGLIPRNFLDTPRWLQLQNNLFVYKHHNQIRDILKINIVIKVCLKDTSV